VGEKVNYGVTMSEAQTFLVTIVAAGWVGVVVFTLLIMVFMKDDT
jgi:hypothetical protein